ncbi:hypothetical protein ACIBJI_14455 [Nocardia sp. NPDC050408]|uniref:hypothetical protein n=1 Tax=unclassified Nocardia TaxID=2637762 RepID=UPI0034478507
MSSEKDRTRRNWLWLLAAILVVQGFGSGITEALWGSSFGVSGILIGGLGAPAWVSWPIGVAGLIMAGWAAFGSSGSRNEDRRRI